MKNLLIGLAVVIASATAAHAQGSIDYSLAPSLSRVAVSSETAVKGSDRIVVRQAVEPALQRAVIASGDDPSQVRVAIERILRTCHVPQSKKAYPMGDLSCPAQQGSYDAFTNLLNVVIGLINTNTTPADTMIGSGGPPYAGPLTIMTAGPDYRHLR